MANLDHLQTPNDVYIYFGKIKCKLCNSNLEVDENTVKIEDEYLCSAWCSHQHYTYNIYWKFIESIYNDSEVFSFDFNDKSYNVCFHHIDIGVYRDNVALITIDNITFEAKVSDFSDVVFSEDNLVKRIETIRLLK